MHHQWRSIIGILSRSAGGGRCCALLVTVAGGRRAPEGVVLEPWKGGYFELLLLTDVHELHGVVILRTISRSGRMNDASVAAVQ